VHTGVVHNEQLRDLLERHFKEWTVIDKRDHMEVIAWLKVNGVKVHLSGTRRTVMDTIQGLITALVVSERVPAEWGTE